jgi:hypothetical protein
MHLSSRTFIRKPPFDFQTLPKFNTQINRPPPSPSPSEGEEAGIKNVTLTVDGSSFVSGASVRWNGSSRTTTFISPNQLQASITASDISIPGIASISVKNPDGTTTHTIVLGYMSGNVMVMGFFPKRDNVKPGDTVVWKLSTMEDAPHTVTFLMVDRMYRLSPSLFIKTIQWLW